MFGVIPFVKLENNPFKCLALVLERKQSFLFQICAQVGIKLTCSATWKVQESKMGTVLLRQYQIIL